MKLTKETRRVIEWLDSEFGEAWSRFAHNPVERCSLIDEYHTCREQQVIEHWLATDPADRLEDYVPLWDSEDSEGYVEHAMWSGQFQFYAHDLDVLHNQSEWGYSVVALYPDEEWVM